MCQQHWRLRSTTYKRHRCCFSSCTQGLPVPSSCFLHPTSAPASPVHPLHPHCSLQRAMVWSRSRALGPAADPRAARPPARKHLPALGPLPGHARGTGSDSRPGFPSDQHPAEICQQPRRTQPEDHIGLGVRAGLNPSPTGKDWCWTRVVQVDRQYRNWRIGERRSKRRTEQKERKKSEVATSDVGIGETPVLLFSFVKSKGKDPWVQMRKGQRGFVRVSQAHLVSSPGMALSG